MLLKSGISRKVAAPNREISRTYLVENRESVQEYKMVVTLSVATGDCRRTPLILNT